MKMKKKAFGDNVTRQVNTANSILLYIFIQNPMYIHKYITHLNYSPVVSWAFLRITATTFVHLHCTKLMQWLPLPRFLSTYAIL